MADQRLKAIKIKTGVVRRLAKEKITYEQEADEQKIRIERMRKDGRDDYEIRKQEEVLGESLMMVPDCQRRLLTAYEDLKGIIDKEKDLKETQEYIGAKKVLEEAKPLLPKPGEVHMC